MSPEDSRHLNNLLKNFEAERLGEGDAVVGANVLAAMGVSLANIQRPGSGLTTWLGDTMAAGTSLYISGAHSCSHISGKVLNGLASRQNNLIARLLKWRRNIGEGTFNAVSNQLHPDQATLWNEEIIEQVLKPVSMCAKQANESWSVLVQVPPRIELRDLYESPLVFLTGVTAEKVAGQLTRCHLGRPYIHVGLDGVSDFAQFQHHVPAIMDGRMAVGALADRICGEVMVMDPNALLGEAVRDDLPSARWISRMPWLVDGNAGPGLDDAEGAVPTVALGGVQKRYEFAMGLAWGQRLNDRENLPVMV